LGGMLKEAFRSRFVYRDCRDSIFLETSGRAVEIRIHVYYFAHRESHPEKVANDYQRIF